MATWLSNHCIGLNQRGYGALLAEACFTSARVSCVSALLLYLFILVVAF